MCCQDGVLFHPARGTFQLQKLAAYHRPLQCQQFRSGMAEVQRARQQRQRRDAERHKVKGDLCGRPKASVGSPLNKKVSAFLRSRFTSGSLMQPFLSNNCSCPDDVWLRRRTEAATGVCCYRRGHRMRFYHQNCTAAPSSSSNSAVVVFLQQQEVNSCAILILQQQEVNNCASVAHTWFVGVHTCTKQLTKLISCQNSPPCKL
jgi:hypothetical protein